MTFIVNRAPIPCWSDILVRVGIHALVSKIMGSQKSQVRLPNGTHFNHKRRRSHRKLVDWIDLTLNLLSIDVIDQMAEVLFDRSPPEFHAGGQSSIPTRKFLAGYAKLLQFLELWQSLIQLGNDLGIPRSHLRQLHKFFS